MATSAVRWFNHTADVWDNILYVCSLSPLSAMIATSHLIISTCGGLLAILIALLVVVWLARPALVLQAVMW
jgi:hypothetical protein